MNGGHVELARMNGGHVVLAKRLGNAQVGGEFLAAHYPHKVIYLPTPTWANHNKIFPNAGLEVRKYRYYLPRTRLLDFEVRLTSLISSLSHCHYWVLHASSQVSLSSETVSGALLQCKL